MRVHCVDVRVSHERLIELAQSEGLLPDLGDGFVWTVSDIQDINGEAMIQFDATPEES